MNKKINVVKMSIQTNFSELFHLLKLDSQSTLTLNFRCLTWNLNMSLWFLMCRSPLVLCHLNTVVITHFLNGVWFEVWWFCSFQFHTFNTEGLLELNAHTLIFPKPLFFPFWRLLPLRKTVLLWNWKGY